MKALSKRKRVSRIKDLISILHNNERLGNLFCTFNNIEFVDNYYICNMYLRLYRSNIESDYSEIDNIKNENRTQAWLSEDCNSISEERRIKIIALLFLIELLKQSKS